MADNIELNDEELEDIEAVWDQLFPEKEEHPVLKLRRKYKTNRPKVEEPLPGQNSALNEKLE